MLKNVIPEPTENDEKNSLFFAQFGAIKRQKTVLGPMKRQNAYFEAQAYIFCMFEDMS